MIKRKFIKELYVDEVICDNCGEPMEKGPVTIHDNVKRAIIFNCTNKNCANAISFPIAHFPGNVVYIYDTERELLLNNSETDYDITNVVEQGDN